MADHRPTATRRTLLAARRFTRRGLLQSGLAAGALALAGCQAAPGGASPRRLNLAIWSDYLPGELRADFAAETGVEIAATSYGTNGELLAKLRAAGEGAFDLVSPTLDRAPLWQHQGLLQPIDLARLDSGAILPPLMAQSRRYWTWNGELHHLPLLWGTEALAWRTDAWSPPKELSFGDLWRPEVKGRMQARPHSLMVGIGLYLDGSGELPSDRLADSYRDPGEMDRVWRRITEFAIDHRFWVHQFWRDGTDQRLGFTEEGCVIGQTWDGPVVDMMLAGEPLAYRAPREGALAWLDGLSIPAGARNRDEAYLFLNWLCRPAVAGRLAAATGYNPALVGAPDFMPAAERDAYQASLPGDALERLWFWPPTPEWYRRKRAEYHASYLKVAQRDPESA
jgi:spermidine/putrescine transport system substrate-binding protein